MKSVVLVDFNEPRERVTLTWLSEHTTSGAEVTREDLPAALHALADELVRLEARRAGIPD